jgi:hypothetical protein
MAYLQAGAGALGVASKAPQIYTIWREGGTGHIKSETANEAVEDELVVNFLEGCEDSG